MITLLQLSPMAVLKKAISNTLRTQDWVHMILHFNCPFLPRNKIFGSTAAGAWALLACPQQQAAE
jgi:hypothetical protein